MRCPGSAEPLPDSLSPEAHFRLLSAAAPARKSKLHGTRACSRLTGCAVRHTGNVCHQPWAAKPAGVAVNRRCSSRDTTGHPQRQTKWRAANTRRWQASSRHVVRYIEARPGAALGRIGDADGADVLDAAKRRTPGRERAT